MGVFGGLTVKPPSADLTVVAVIRDWAWAIEGAKIASNPSQQADLSILTGQCFYS